MTFFNRGARNEFNAALAHRHSFDSRIGFLLVEGPSGSATLLRCKCGQAQWFVK